MESHNGLPGVSRNTAIVKEEPNEIIVVDPLGSIDFTDSELNLSSAVENELAVTYVEGRARRVISSEVDIKIEPGMLSTVEDPEAAYSSHSFELDSDSNILDDGESDVNSCTEGVLTSDQVELMMKREPHSNLKVPTSAASSLRKQLVSMSQSNSSIGENPSFLRKGLKKHSGPGAQSFSLSNSMETNSKKRAPNFSSTEKHILAEMVAEEATIIETKSVNTVSRAEKQEAWQRVADRYNATSGYSPRSSESLKIAWENMKKTARKAASEQKKEFYLTGGGSQNGPRLTSIDEAVLSIITASTTGLHNEFDGDAGEEFATDECAATIDTTVRATTVDNHDDRSSMKVLYQMEDGCTVPGQLPTVEESDPKTKHRKILRHTHHNDRQETPPDRAKAVITHKRRDLPSILYKRKNLAFGIKQQSTISEPDALAEILKRQAPSMSLNDELLTEKILLTKAQRRGQELDNEKKRVELEILKLELAKNRKCHNLQFTMNDEKLIELVREQPILYDTTQKGYNNINLKANVWDAIAAKFDFQSGDEAKNMWLKLRDAYRSSLKRLETRSGDEGFPSKSAKWKFSDQMSFLKPYMKDRKRHTTDTNVIVPIVEIHDEAASRPRIRFTDEDDLFLLKEVAAENPFEDGSKWKVVADKMKGKFSKAFTPRNLRERINHLLQRYNLHFEEWMVARNKDEATLERITLLQETRDMKQEFRGKRLKKSEQVASQTGKMLRDEAAKNHASTSQHVGDEMVETTVVPTDVEFILDYPNGDTIEINDVNSPSQTSTSTPPSAPNSGNLPSEPGPPLPPLCLITRSLPTPSPLSGALVENSPSPNQMNDDPGILSNAAPSTARLLKRKRGMNASVDSFMAKKQHMSSFYLKRRQLELEERKFEEEVTRKRMELELEEKKYNLQLRMFEQQVKKEGETLRFISDLMARQETRDTTLLHLIGKVLKVVEELVKK
ncbi:hypothetical protein GE061_011743 [Apolygus lucorum]|uniref:Regulatory protein zeste n=1 Tax=Apolygus lucorum TaxID=248454 RepID=A0A8S9XZK4_APOLU|nr:hypothetical protein GE061_011743 [Apolygus lucorum]